MLLPGPVEIVLNQADQIPDSWVRRGNSGSGEKDDGARQSWSLGNHRQKTKECNTNNATLPMRPQSEGPAEPPAPGLALLSREAPGAQTEQLGHASRTCVF